MSGSVTFAPNETSQSFSVTILDDSTPEIPESFYILLINATLLSDPGIHLGSDSTCDYMYLSSYNLSDFLSFSLTNCFHGN